MWAWSCGDVALKRELSCGDDADSSSEIAAASRRDECASVRVRALVCARMFAGVFGVAVVFARL